MPLRISLFFSALALLFSAPLCKAAVIAEYTFDSCTVQDSSGNGLHGTLSGATPSCVPGQSGQALSLPGSGSYIEVPYNPLLAPPATLTLEAVVKPTTIGNFLIFSSQNGNGDGISLMAMPSMVIPPFPGLPPMPATTQLLLAFDLQDQAGRVEAAVLGDFFTPLIPVNQWTSLRVQMDTVLGVVRVYINNVLKLEQTCPTSPFLPLQVPFRIGGVPQNQNLSFVGEVDNVRVSTEDPLLTVTLGGNAGGSVNSVPPGIACTASSCTNYFPFNSSVGLVAAPATNAIFGGWSGGCAGTGDCSVTMSAQRSVGATFLTNMKVKVPGTPDRFYRNLSRAYAPASGTVNLLARSTTFDEDFVLDRPVTVRFSGGYDAYFTSQAGRSTVQGTVAVQRGTLVAKNLAILSPSMPVSRSIPADNADGVPVSSPVQVKRTELLNPASVTAATVSLWGTGRYGSFRVPGTVAYNPTLRTMSFRHGGLLPGYSYSLRLEGLVTSTGTSLPATTVDFSTLRNQLSKTVHYEPNGSVARYLLYPQNTDGLLAERKEFVSSGPDTTWFTDDDLPGSREIFTYSPARQMLYRDSYINDVYSLYTTYDYTAAGSVARESNFASGTAAVTTWSYDLQGRAERMNSLDRGVDGTWNTADDRVAFHVAPQYDGAGRKTRDVTWRSIDPDGVPLPGTTVWSYVAYAYDTRGFVSRRTFYEGIGGDASWFTADDAVSGYWDYSYPVDGRLTGSVFRGQPGSDGIWLTADDTITGRVEYRYDEDGNLTGRTVYRGAGSDGAWFTADDVRATVDTYDTAR